MAKYVYFSLIPESLVVSMLEPSSFGTYLAAGTRKRAKEEAIFFEVDPEKVGNEFNLRQAMDRCEPHEDGQPKHSVYASIYRVLERLPLDALGSLWLATPDGRTLELKSQDLPENINQQYHLYQELAPVHPLIASLLNPVDFCKSVTDQSKSVSLPAVCAAELELAGLADDPENGSAEQLPYKNIEHLRDCLKELKTRNKQTKTVDRIHSQHVQYRVIKTGFFVAKNQQVKFYNFPSDDYLDKEHHQWWRSASLC